MSFEGQKPDPIEINFGDETPEVEKVENNSESAEDLEITPSSLFDLEAAKLESPMLILVRMEGMRRLMAANKEAAKTVPEAQKKAVGDDMKFLKETYAQMENILKSKEGDGEDLASAA